MAEYAIERAGTTVKVEADLLKRAEPPDKKVSRPKKIKKTDITIVLKKLPPKTKKFQNTVHDPLPRVERKLSKGIFRGYFDRNRSIAYCYHSQGVSVDFALTLGLNYSFQAFQEKLNIFFFHAASMVIGGRAYLFPAPSGGGKSTISGLARNKGITVLGDDTCLVKRIGRKFFVSAYPVSSFPDDGKDLWEVDSVLFLEKSRMNRLKRITSIEAMMRAIPEAAGHPFGWVEDPGPRSGYLKYIFRSLSAMLDSVRFGALDFSKNGEVFSCLD